MKFLQEQVIDKAAQGWILGPPGTGKSTTTLAFAAILDKSKWVVTWIHLDRIATTSCVRLEAGRKKVLSLESVDNLKSILNDCDSSKQHILFLDGYAKGYEKFLRVANTWLSEDSCTRRIVVVCSMSIRGGNYDVYDHKYKVQVFNVFSWKLDEYQKAAEVDPLFNNIEDKLDAHNAEPNTEESNLRKSLVASKFCYAGGSSRYMFDFTTSEVIKFLDSAVSCVGDIRVYTTGMIGDNANNVVNRLFGRYYIGGSIHTRIISQYALFKASCKHGPELIKQLEQAVEHLSNPTFEGWIFEFLFFAKLAKYGVKLYDADDKIEKQWAPSVCSIFDPQLNEFPEFPDKEAIWLKPKKWNQGGFDAVFVDRKIGGVCFLQITKGTSHDFNLYYFRQFFESLVNSNQSFEVKDLQVLFVVEKDKFKDFQVNVKHPGLLTAFGWKKFEEVNNVKILIMKTDDDVFL
jgi:hypothetical protein